MKNILLILALLIGVNSFCQSDTIVFFESKTINKIIPLILFETEFKTIDTILFDSNNDSTLWTNSRWIRKDSIYVNSKTYKIKEIQFRMNQQGIKQRKVRLIRYSEITIKRRGIRQ